MNQTLPAGPQESLGPVAASARRAFTVRRPGTYGPPLWPGPKEGWMSLLGTRVSARTSGRGADVRGHSTAGSFSGPVRPRDRRC